MRVLPTTRRTAVALGVTAAVLLSGGTQAAGLSAYTVRRGDTLSQLARRFSVPVGVLAQANGIGNVDLIRDGQKITVPMAGTASGKAAAKPPASPVVEMTGGNSHVVREGESLATIARKYGTTVNALAAANRITDPNRIRIGSRLAVPGSGSWVCPVKGQPRTVVNNWGAPRPGYRQHRGNDIFANHGASVVAPVSGIVTHVNGSVAGYAFYLAGDDGHRYYGSHLAGFVRGPGRVKAGEAIGRVGNTGNARTTPPHLHFEIHPRGGDAVNPWFTLRRWC